MTAGSLDLDEIRRRAPTELVVEGALAPTAPTKPAGRAGVDCAEVPPDPAVGDQTLVACARVVPTDTGALKAAAKAMGAGGDDRVAPLVGGGSWEEAPDSGPIPRYCGVQADEEDYYGRLRECHAGSVLYTIYKRPENIPLGNALISYWEWEELSNKRRSWTHQIRVYVNSVDGIAAGTTFLHGQGWCDGACDLGRPDAQQYFLLSEADWFSGSWDMARMGGEDRDTVYGTADTDFTFLNPATGTTTQWTDVEFRVRCDSTLQSTPAEGGCVFNEVVPELALDKSTSSDHRLHALFVEDAQRTTPDHYGARHLAGGPLHRLTDEGERGENYQASCHDFVKDPSVPDDSCDEYPYQSTYEGAAKIGRDRTAVGHVPLGHNTAGGRRLAAFYLANRVINGDPFWVAVVDGVGDGGEPGRDRPPTVSAGDDVTGDEGAAIQLDGSADDDQGPPAVRWSYEPAQPVDPGTVCTFGNPDGTSTTFTCNDDGVFVVTLTADDGVNSPVSDDLTAVVRNVAPRIPRNIPIATGVRSAAAVPGPAPWSLFRVDTPVELTVPYDDPGSNDTQTCAVDWDEGTAPEEYAARDRACDRSHVFRQAGMYTIAATATDDDGDSESWSTMIVVYDPDAGAVNLDAATETPPGALVAGPDSAEWTWAHLTARYYTAAGPPVGEAKTWIPQTDYRVEPTSDIHWLVVTPDGKVAAKGTSTTAAGVDVGFVLYGYRGCPRTGPDCQAGPHRMRAVVWPLSSGPHPGTETMYDNRPSAGYDLDVAEPQPVTAGSVQIHH